MVRGIPWDSLELKAAPEQSVARGSTFPHELLPADEFVAAFGEFAHKPTRLAWADGRPAMVHRVFAADQMLMRMCCRRSLAYSDLRYRMKK